MIQILRRHNRSKEAAEAIAEAMTHDVVVAQPGEVEEATLVFRWGCTATVPCRNVVNSAKAIHLVNDKAGFREYIQEHSDNLVPRTWFHWRSYASYPWIVRPRNHFQGRNLYLCNDHNEVMTALVSYPEGTYYISEYIPKVAEYRVFVVQGRIAFIYRKIPADPSDIAWNHAQGSKSVNVRWRDWPKDVCEKAIQAFNLSGLDFGAVDVIVDNDDKAYVLEINTAPSLESPYRTSCVAKCFDYIIENGRAHIDPYPGWSGWRGVIHPAISEEAI